MAPRKKQTASAASADMIPSFPAPPSAKAPERRQTPEQRPAQPQRAMGITQAQKQALIDNLQLEITERARKLRAQYALQAQGLRSRLEMRINRIPQALRNRNIQDLVDEHAEKAKPKPAPAVPVIEARQTLRHEAPAPMPSARKSLKRTSEHFSILSDKENQPSQHQDQGQETLAHLANPKKRPKLGQPTTTTTTTTTAAAAAANTKASRSKAVLSPKSHNSRTLPRSPTKATYTSPDKNLGPNPFAVARPASPIKPLLSTTHATASSKPGSRVPSRQTTKKPAAPAATSSNAGAGDSDGRSSEASTVSAGTTIVTRPAATGGAKKAAVGRKPAVPKAPAAAATAKRAAAKKEVLPPVPVPATGTTVAGGRTLRKRG